MATQQKEFLIRVAADIKDARQLAAVSRFLNDMGEAGAGAAADGLKKTKKGADEADESVKNLSRSVLNFGAVVAAFQLARGFVAMNLEFQAIQSTLTAATGDAAAAGSEYRFLTAEADRLGLSIQALARPYAQLVAASKGTVLEGQATRDIFIAVAEAGSVLKLSTEASERAMGAIQQMMSKGTVSAEELRLQLGDVLPGAMQIAARAAGVTTDEFQKMLANGEVLSGQFLPRFAEEIRKTFGPGVEKSVSSLAAELNRLKNTVFELGTAVGEAGVTKFLTDLAKAANTGVLALRELIRTGDLLNNKTFQQLAQDFRSSTEGGAKPVTDFMLQGVNAKPPASAPQGPSPEEIDKANEAARKYFETLNLQAAVLKRGEFAAIDYRRAHGDLKDATKEQMQAVYDSIFAYASVREELEKAKKVEQENINIMRERNALMDEGTRLQESLRTPLEAFAAELERVSRLWQQGAINTETYERAVVRAQKTMDTAIAKMSEMDADAKKFSSTMEGAFSTLFFDVMDGKFENMADNFSRALKRMIAEMLASRLFTALGGAGAGGGATPGTPAPVSPPGQFAAANTGLSARSTGITKPDGPGLPSDAGAGGQVIVTLENKGTPQTVQQGRAQFDARGLVVNLVTDDLRSGGPIATTLERTYNARRKV